ncbi:MAG: right-handed parallel beta-helix repeat-containing protein [Candidatus Aenigmarchaeota archaeon]|nr:right-handed parallel beta-helix repeat-containing protein [Candidatus Aenigmarchaeota archaeon]
MIVFVSGCVGQGPGMNPTVITGKTTIEKSGLYVLNSDISCTAEGEMDVCIDIQRHDAVLDCQGHSITLANQQARRGPASTGIYIAGSGVEDVTARNTVRNCRIENFAFGIFLKASSNNFINNTISNNGIGIYYDDFSSYNIFINNTVSNNNNRGIYLFMRSSNNNFTGNIVRNNSIYGIIITCAAHHNTFSNNVVEGNGYGSTSDENGGIYILNSYANVFSGNGICNNSKTIKCKFDATMEGISDICRPQVLPDTIPIDRDAQEAGNLIDGGGNTCGPSSMSCDGTTISCIRGCP